MIKIYLTGSFVWPVFHLINCNLSNLMPFTIQHYVIKFVSYLWQADGFLRVLLSPPPIKLTATIQLKYCPFQKWLYILWINRYTYKVNFLVLFRDTSRQTLSSWTRLVGQTCRIPNNLHNMLPGGRKGIVVHVYNFSTQKLD
jgi:hypothetical protein